MEAMTGPNAAVLVFAPNFVLCFELNGALSAVAHRFISIRVVGLYPALPRRLLRATCEIATGPPTWSQHI
jgi:hypothetical protein